MVSEYLALYNSINHISPLLEIEWEDFKSKWKPVSLNRNEFLTQAGQVEKYFYFVEEGVIRAYILKDGNEISIGFSYDNDYSGAYDSFLDQKPSDIYLQALTKCSILRISFDDLTEMFDSHKGIERWGRIFNSKILIDMARRQIEVRAFSAEERFDRLHNDSPHIFQLVPQKYLASYLGMTPETFSRLRRLKASH